MESINSFDIVISKDKARQIAEASLLDLDIQVLGHPGCNTKRYAGQIVNERTNLVLCQTEEIFFNEEHAQSVLHKIIAAIQTEGKSKKFTTKIYYNFRID